jgi:hypothetical protein
MTITHREIQRIGLSSPLKVDKSKLFNSEYRQNALSLVYETLKKDGRIIGALLVGSGAVGFRDEYSDLDLAVVVEGGTVDVVYQEWEAKIMQLVPVIEHFREPSIHLLGFLLEGFLEFDISFQSPAGLYAHMPHWRILFDKQGSMASLMKPREPESRYSKANHEKRTSESWYGVIHCISSIERHLPLRSTFFIDTLRNEAICMAGLNRGLRTGTESFLDDADQLPEAIKEVIKTAYPTGLLPRDLLTALKAAVEIYFSESIALDHKLELNKAFQPSQSMMGYLEVFRS